MTVDAPLSPPGRIATAYSLGGSVPWPKNSVAMAGVPPLFPNSGLPEASVVSCQSI
jgi:hypothetical protein